MLCNIDPANPANTATPAQLKEIGFGGVRVVSRPEVAQAVSVFQAAGLFVLSVVTEQSGGFLLPNADVTQIGNEPDIAGTADSMSAQDYANYLQLYRNTYPSLTMITGGLASAQPTFLRDVRDAGGLQGFNGVSIHYPASGALINGFAKYTSGLPIYVTEWNTQASRIPGYRVMLREAHVVLDAWFCFGYGQWALTEDQKRVLLATN